MNMPASEVRLGNLIGGQEVVDISGEGYGLRIEVEGGGRPGRVLHVQQGDLLDVH